MVHNRGAVPGLAGRVVSPPGKGGRGAVLGEDGGDYRVEPLDLRAMSDARPLRGATTGPGPPAVRLNGIGSGPTVHERIVALPGFGHAAGLAWESFRIVQRGG